MGLGDCIGCWDAHCQCADGKGWLGFSREHLLKIRAAIDAALAQTPETEPRA